MGFFGDNASTGNYPSIEDGSYTCRFKAIEKTRMASFNDPNVQEDKFRFEFETTEEVDDENGAPYRITKITGTFYGGPKAGLTQIIDGMVGRHLSDSEFAALDLADLKKTLYKVTVTQTPNDSGRLVNKIVSVKPLKAKAKEAAKPAPVVTAEPDEDGEDNSNDPFAE